MRQRDYDNIKVGDTIVYKTGLVIGISYGNFCFYKEHLINSVVSGHSKFHVGCVMVGKNSWFVSRQMISGVIDKNGKLKYFSNARKVVTKPISLPNFDNCKVEVPTPEISEKVWNRLKELGYKTEYYNRNKVYIFIYSNKSFNSFNIIKSDFANHTFKQIHYTAIIGKEEEKLTDEWEYVGTDLKIITTLKTPHGEISGARKTGRKYRFISRGKYGLVDKLEKPVEDLVEKYSKLQVKHIKLQQEYLDLLKKGEN